MIWFRVTPPLDGHSFVLFNFGTLPLVKKHSKEPNNCITGKNSLKSQCTPLAALLFIEKEIGLISYQYRPEENIQFFILTMLYLIIPVHCSSKETEGGEEDC